MPSFEHTPPPYEGPSIEKIKALREEHLNPAMFLFYKKPIMLHYGKNQYVWDHTNKRYLDLFGGIVTVGIGHNNEQVNKAAIDQINKINHTTTIYLNNQIAEYAKELSEKFPANLRNFYFVNSGSEANELAVHIARLYTGNYPMISTRQGYHGMSGLSQGLTNINSWNYNIPKTYGFEKTIAPDSYRGQYTGPEAGEKYAEDVRQTIQFCTSGKIAGFICEPIQGVGGTVEVPEGYLKKAYEYVRQAGGLNICDEVQTGFGRLGSHYWGFQKHDVQPDIVVMAKSIGNGFPLAAVATSKEIASSMKGKLHFNTYGGNPVSCAAGRAVLKYIDEFQIQKNCLERGKQLKEGLNQLKAKYECIGDVRGQGLLLGVDIVVSKKCKTPNVPATLEVFEKTKDYGILVGKGGSFGNVLRIKPPMIITKEDVDFCLNVLDRSFWEAENSKN